MPSNTTNYAKKYYEEVIKPKRKKAQKERAKEVQKEYSGIITVDRTCPICGKKWQETIEWKSTRVPSATKQCKQCILQKQKEYTSRSEVKEKINARLRKNYSERAELRERKKELTYNWREKILSDETTAKEYREREKKKAKDYYERSKKK